MGRRFAPLELDEVERAELTALASRRSTAQALALRARIILACADGEQSKVVAARLAVDPDTVGKWRRRFSGHRLEGLWDEPRSGTPRTIEDARIEAVIVRTLETQPPDAPTGVRAAWRGPVGCQSRQYSGYRPAAASVGDLQALNRSRLRRQGSRRCRPLRSPARARYRTVCR
jgi:transposase-like protein